MYVLNDLHLYYKLGYMAKPASRVHEGSTRSDVIGLVARSVVFGLSHRSQRRLFILLILDIAKRKCLEEYFVRLVALHRRFLQ